MNDQSGGVTGVAKTFMDAMKEQPLSLALVVMNLGLLLFLFYTENHYADGRKFAFNSIIQQQMAIAELLSRCVVPEELRKKMPQLPPPPPS